jgi:hypothetical protein
MRLTHGILKLRKGRDKVAVTAMENVLEKAQALGFLRTASHLQCTALHEDHSFRCNLRIDFVPTLAHFESRPDVA